MDTGCVYQVNCFNVGDSDSGQRLDLFLSGERTDLSRSHIQRLIGDGLAEVNGRPAKAGHRLKQGDTVVLRIPPPVELVVQPEPIPLDIYYEDYDLLVINKPRGMVVHPAPGNHTGTLVNALLYHCRDLSGINGVVRPGIIHRLDKDTSGLLMVAKNDFAHLDLARQLSERKVRKNYLALVRGTLREDRGTVNAPIGRHHVDRQKMAVEFRNGKPAVTHYSVIERYSGLTYIMVRLETGRTHQIRVHMAYIGHPLLGDKKYGQPQNSFGLEGQFLHAAQLGFLHPRSREEMFFEAPLPEELEKILKEINAHTE
ncbi:MAG: RluA family pseudouridine synthase [Bacillota bacterium]